MTTPKRGGDDPSSSGENSTPANPGATPETTTPDEFHKFMVALATDPAKLGEFIKDPDATMKAAGISDVDQVILKSGQPATIHARLSGQKFSLTPPPPVVTSLITMLVVDLARKPGAPESAAADHPTLRTGPTFAVPPNQINPHMFPNFPIHPQIHPVFPQVHPVFQQLHPVFPQVHPPITQNLHPIFPIHPVFPVHPVFPIHPVFPVHPQLVNQFPPGPMLVPQIHPQILPQIHPQILPQIHPQILSQLHPQLVFHPQITQQLTPLVFHPQILSQLHPQMVFHPQITQQLTPLVFHPQILSQLHPQMVFHPQILSQLHPQIVFPQIHPPIFPSNQ